MKVIICVLAMFLVLALGAEKPFKMDDDTIRARFKLLDLNGNGVLSRDEMRKFLENPEQHPEFGYNNDKSIDEQLDQLFAIADKDKSDSLSVEEIINYVNSPDYDFFGFKTGKPAAGFGV